MKSHKFRKLKLRGYDRIKEEYMMGKHGELTDKQLEYILTHCKEQGHGGVLLCKKNNSKKTSLKIESKEPSKEIEK